MEFLNSVLFFVIAIGVLVTVHEYGHFWVARRLGVKVCASPSVSGGRSGRGARVQTKPSTLSPPYRLAAM